MTTIQGFSRRQVLSLTAAAVGASAWPSHAQANTKIVFGFTAVNDFASVFVAKEEGYFSKRGLDVEPKFIPLNPSIPAAIQSDSLQMGGPTPSVYLQAVDGGLDHVVVGGGGREGVHPPSDCPRRPHPNGAWARTVEPWVCACGYCSRR